MNQDIRDMQIKAMRYLIRSNDHFAIRALPVAERAFVPERIFSGENLEQALNWADGKNTQDYKGVYFTINPTVSEIPRRDDGRQEQVKDAHILRRTTLYIDVDSIKTPEDKSINGKHVCATPEELERTMALAQEIVDYLSQMGFDIEPLIINSGNGCHLFYPIDMPNDNDSLKLIADFLKTLSEKFTCDRGDVDEKIKNAARICRLTGTMNRKGEDGIEEGREHRVCHVVSYPSVDADTWQNSPISTEKLEQIAALSRIAKVEKVRQQAADRKAKSRGGRVKEYAPRQTQNTQEKKTMSQTFINRADFIIQHVNNWIDIAYQTTKAPEDRNDWLGFLSAIKEIMGEMGWADFDKWCQNSSSYDYQGNRKAWDAPAQTEGYATECLKLAASFAKLGFDLDAVAEEMGFVLSREKIMSIQEIKDAMANDNNLTVRWTWSANKGVWYPCSVWSKDWTTRRLEAFDDSDRGKAFMSVIIATELIHDRLEPVFPKVVKSTGEVMVFNEIKGVWDMATESQLNQLVSRHNGFSVIGRDKSGNAKRLVARDTNYEVNNMRRQFEQIMIENSCVLALKDAKLTWRRGAQAVSASDLRSMDYLTSTLPFNLKDCQNPSCPQYDAVLNRLFENDAERIECWLQWQGAVLFSATTTLQMPMVLLVSETGGTGKSMLLKILEHLLGRDNSSFSPLEDFKDRGVLLDLAGKKINIDYDMDLATVMDNVSVLKQLVTGEVIKRRIVGSAKTVEFAYKGAMVAAANGTPTFKRYDAGLDRRLLVLPTTNVALGAREKVYGYDQDIFEAEGAAIIAKSIAAFERMLAHGVFEIPQICAEAKSEMRANVDNLAEYLHGVWEASEDSKPVLIKDMFEHYLSWCSQNRCTPMSSRRFLTEARMKLEMDGVKITKPQNNWAAKIQLREASREVFGFRK